MKLIKFSSNCLTNGPQIRKIISIIKKEQIESPAIRLAVVLSAISGVRDDLIAGSRLAAVSREGHVHRIQKVREKHIRVIRQLFHPQKQTKIITAFQLIMNEIEEILHGVELIKECTSRTLDILLNFGEKVICLIVSEFMNEEGIASYPVDSGDIIVTETRDNRIIVDFNKSYRKIRDRLSIAEGIPVITGSSASSEEGIITSLGDKGADYTASIIAAGMDAEKIEIWTDMDGIMSADPKYVNDAFVIPELSYQEAMELSYFGARFVHPHTMIPAVEKNIPIALKNFIRPQSPGTIIKRVREFPSDPVTGIASIDKIALLNIEGSGMVGIPGMAARIFSTLAKADVNIIMISQASSEHSICLVFKEEESEAALETVRNELTLEIEAKRIQELSLLKNLAIIAIIGENMRGTPGISGKLFSSLGGEEINILAIAQGSSERNISFVIHKKDEKPALKTIHKAFLFGDTKKKGTDEPA